MHFVDKIYTAFAQKIVNIIILYFIPNGCFYYKENAELR